MLKQGQHITIRYEDLILATRQMLSTIVGFLDVEFSESMLDYAQRNTLERLEPMETMRWKMKLNQKLEKSNIGKFHKALAKDEIFIFEQRCEEQLKYYGYK